MDEAKSNVPKSYYADPDLAIYQGDCRRILSTFPNECVDFVLTDPPYLVSYRGRWGSDWETISGDEEPSWLAPAFLEIQRVLKQNSLCLSFYGWPHADRFLTVWKFAGFRAVSHIVCVKEQIGLGFYTRSQHETAYLLAKGNPPKPTTATPDVFPWSREDGALHPNQKPLGAMSRLISTYTAEGQVVLDPFMGSGTTLIAARTLGRRAIGIEIEEHYCELASKRLAQRIFNFEREEPLAKQRELSLIDHSGSPE